MKLTNPSRNWARLVCIMATVGLAGPLVAQEPAQEAAQAAEQAPEEAATESAPVARVIDTLRLDSSSVIGNRELPKVMYIVPWKKAAPGDLPGRPAESLLDEVLSPVDREVFIRQVRFYNEIYGNGAEDAGR